MPIDVNTPESPGWWLKRLAKKLQDRQPRLALLHSYLSGDPPLPEGAVNARRAYQAFQKSARTNYADLIVSALQNRMTPTGFRSADDARPDRQAQEYWDRNALDVEWVEICENMLSMGDGYAIVGPARDGSDIPVVTAEDPRQVVTIHDPVQQRIVRAGLKMFHDPEAEENLAYLYLPAGGGREFAEVHVAFQPSKRGTIRFAPGSWEWDEDRFVTLPHQRVPVVRFRNKRGVGEYEPHIDVLNRINHMILQRMVIATMQAFRQRAIKVPKEDMPDLDPETGEPIDWDEVFAADPGALWRIPASAELWESGQVDLGPILSSVKDDVRDLAAVTSTPLSYLMPDAAGQSAEGASLVREGLTFKADDRIKRASQGLLDVVELCFLTAKQEVPANLRMTWAPTVRYSLAERADAASKADDIPWRTKMIEIWQFPPEQVDQMEVERAGDLMLASTIAAPDVET